METLTPFTAFDRCDRCGAQAYIRAARLGDGELLFCAHHGRKHHDRLVAGGWLIENDNA